MSAGAYFLANFDGRCSECPEPIKRGDEVRFVDHVLQHGHCPDHEPVQVERDVCPACFTERSVTGACACEDGAA